MNIDPDTLKNFQQAYELGQKIVDLVKNHRADAALLGCLAAMALLRRKTTITLDDMLNRMKTIDQIVDMAKIMFPSKAAKTDG